ncbi:MAG TPA: NADH-quinone oxidoreductase subunit NuoH [Bacillota bacterium]|nr:NADH-quinone oxidoreductase subunit NuoH [Bacillota bacterium]
MSLGYVLLRSVILVLLLMGAFAYFMVAERKVIGYFQLRWGPVRVGPWGLLQPIADALKMVAKEDSAPATADNLIFHLAPAISLFIALAAFAVIPLGPTLHFGSLTLPLSISDPSSGLLFVLAIASLGVYGVSLGGWASQSKYSLMGSLRASAQMVSYELALGLAVISTVVLTGSLDLNRIVGLQAHLWAVVPDILGFVIFLICSVAECNRAPFDLAEAEGELVAGFHTEYSGFRFANFVMAEYINMFTFSALGALLFLGGWNGPFGPSAWWLLIKIAAYLFFFIWLRATFPRIRYDRLMNFGWKVLVPLAFLNLIWISVFVVLGGGH